MKYVSELFKKSVITQAKECYQNDAPFHIVSAIVDTMALIEVAENKDDIAEVLVYGCRSV